MASTRGQFGSKFGFVMAAAGSAVGLGNIWGFPTQTASNGGAAFVLVYLVLAFCLAYPALMAELVVGRYAQANIVTAFRSLGSSPFSRRVGQLVGAAGMLTAVLILSFYAIVAGWMISYLVEPLSQLASVPALGEWAISFGFERNLLFMLAFMFLTILIVVGGVHDGIEKWSTRLMPVLFVLLLSMIGYVFTQEGAVEGLRVYLVPDFSRVADPQLLLSALGQAFFSLSLGVGSMLIYGSYLSKDAHLPRLGAYVTLIDIGIAFTAGLLIIPSMYVAQHHGVQIFSDSGALLNQDTLVFSVLPAFFDTMGATGEIVAVVFFALMTIAALTSSISLLEVPVSYVVEHGWFSRKAASVLTGLAIAGVSTAILLDFGDLFGLVITLSTQYGQPLLGIMFCVFVGWVLHRNALLNEIKAGYPEAERGLFWKIWPLYVKFVCPTFIALALVQSLL